MDYSFQNECWFSFHANSDSKQKVLLKTNNSASRPLVPRGWSRALTQAQHSHRCSFFSVHHWYLLSLTSSQCCLELPTSVGSLLDRWAGTCCALPPLHLPMYGMVQRKRVKTQQASHEKRGISLLECFASQPKLWLLFHLQFLLAYAFVVQYSIQIKVKYLTF